MTSCFARTAPSLDDVAALAEEAFAALPPEFRRLTEGIVFMVQDFPDDQVVADMELESPFDILGLYTGISLADAESGGAGQPPNTVFLYRRPILDYWAEHEETLGALITHVLVHEIGHHFGLSDEDMDRIEAAAGA